MAKILFIIPNETMRESIQETIRDYEQSPEKKYRDSEDCEIELLVQVELDKIDISRRNADILIARGAMASALRRTYKHVPVVDMPITTIDTIDAIRTLRQRSPGKKPIAVIGFGDFSHLIRKGSEISGEELVPFSYLNDNVDALFLSSILDGVERRGCGAVIGGVRTAKMAEERGLPAEVVHDHASRDTIRPALAEAFHIAHIRRTERERAARFETILNHVHDGIITTDTRNRVIQMNSTAAELLDLKERAPGELTLERLIPDPRLIGMLRDNLAYRDELVSLGKKKLVLNKTGIRLEDESIGSVVTFQNVDSVQNTEILIRSKLHRHGLVAKYSFADIIGDSPALRETVKKARVFASAPLNILIVGQTGTGKELFAQSMHSAGQRKAGPFVAVNCAAIPENLMESELFGYEGGAFTGAAKDGKPGYFELAHEGTIFLDEISEIPLNMQGKLLRVIQESEVMRIGSDRIIPVKVRIICATNKDLKELVRQNKFREDLYYRLAVLKLRLPPLKERGADIILLAEHFMRNCDFSWPAREIVLSAEAQSLLLEHEWEGNIRELRNVCEQLVVLNETGYIAEADVRTLLDCQTPMLTDAAKPLGARGEIDFVSERMRFERTQIERAMEANSQNKSRAAKSLGIDRSTLQRKLRELDLAVHGSE